MSNEFKRMQQLAGIKEIQIEPKPNAFTQIFDRWLMREMVPQDVDIRGDAPDAAEYLVSLGQDPPKVNSLEQAVEKIIEIYDTLNGLIGVYPGAHYYETIELPLNRIGKELHLEQYADQILSRLNDIYTEQ